MQRGTCVIEGCDDTVRVISKGLCSSHYIRLRKYGDPLAGGPRKTNITPPSKVVDHPDGTRTCTVCDARLPVDSFDVDKNSKGGRRAQCKPCRSQRMKDWYAANRERQAGRQAARREADPDKLRQQDRERYYRSKPKRIALVEAYGHQRRAAMRASAYDDGITKIRLRKRDGDRCCYCEIVMDFAPGEGRAFVPDRATIEHLVPISAGGTHTWDNVTLCCWQCNQRKNRKSADEWRAILTAERSSA